MKRLIAAVLSAVSVLTLASVLLAAKPADQSPYALPRAATLPIYAAGAEASGCSGVMIAPKVMVTAAHCVDGERTVNDAPTKVIAKNVELDVAVLAVEADCPCVAIGDAATLDEQIIAVGFPMNGTVRQQIVTKGNAQGEALIEKKLRRTVITAPIAPGNSGGGIFALRNGEWQLIGIASGVATFCDFGMGCSLLTHLAFAAPVDAVYALLHPAA